MLVIRVRTGFIRKLMIAAVTLMIAAIWASSCHAAISAGVSNISGINVSYSPPEYERLHVPLPRHAGNKERPGAGHSAGTYDGTGAGQVRRG